MYSNLTQVEETSSRTLYYSSYPACAGASGNRRGASPKEAVIHDKYDSDDNQSESSNFISSHHLVNLVEEVDLMDVQTSVMNSVSRTEKVASEKEKGHDEVANLLSVGRMGVEHHPVMWSGPRILVEDVNAEDLITHQQHPQQHLYLYLYLY